MLTQPKLATFMILAVLSLICAAPSFAQTANPAPAQTRPAQQTVERPFGGPPNRTDALFGTTCATSKVTCVLASPLPIGDSCACKAKGGSTAAGKVVPGN
jgi:hypothetical protein